MFLCNQMSFFKNRSALSLVGWLFKIYHQHISWKTLMVLASFCQLCLRTRWSKNKQGLESFGVVHRYYFHILPNTIVCQHHNAPLTPIYNIFFSHSLNWCVVFGAEFSFQIVRFIASWCPQ